MELKTRFLTITCALTLVSTTLTMVMVKRTFHHIVYSSSGNGTRDMPSAVKPTWSGGDVISMTYGSSHDTGVRTDASTEANNASAVIGREEDTRREHHHVFFLKVHKAASTTVMNLLYRFALKRHLAVMLPREDNILSERYKNWESKAISLPPGLRHFDFLCNHLIFNEPLIRKKLHEDAKFIGIVREPLSQFESSFRYYRRTAKWMTYLQRIPTSDPIRVYLSAPSRWEPAQATDSLTLNRMSFDFGMDGRGLRARQAEKGGAIDAYLKYLDKAFDLVLITERFDESMVLMKRLLGWRLQDVIYLKSNTFRVTRKGVGDSTNNTAGTSSAIHKFTAQERQTHRSYNAADYALYEHFAKVFQDKVDAEGASFREEVKAFQTLLRQVTSLCLHTWGPETEDLTLTATPWSDSFRMKRSECTLMTSEEIPLVDLMRKKQAEWYH